jgi:hypothetical protein
MLSGLSHPLAIAMWDFSWLERRWPGGGYEDWDRVLDELVERGYAAVRIDAYPHLAATGPEREWELLPFWNTQDWGSPALTKVAVQPALNQFIRKCADRSIGVGLSTWFRKDKDNIRMRIATPEDLGKVWRATLDGIVDAGLLESILYIDLCNEWPQTKWAPFLPRAGGADPSRTSPTVQRWMAEPIAMLRDTYPSLDYCFSFNTQFDSWQQQDVSYMDVLELHVWMAQWSDFYERVDYGYERFEAKGYDNLAQRAEPLYRKSPEHWKACLGRGIDLAIEWSLHSGKPLMTTEGWAVVDYKDWPLLEWGWVKELCEFGVHKTAQTGRWAALCTSNFCGPQFVGMWRDVDWHRRLTGLIHESPFHRFDHATAGDTREVEGTNPRTKLGKKEN